MKGFAVIGTDTGVGKTRVSALITKYFAQAGAHYWKPVQTGSDSDTRYVQALLPKAQILPPVYEFPTPVSPHLASSLHQSSIELATLMRFRDSYRDHFLILETAGGLLVPYSYVLNQADFLSVAGLPCLLVVWDRVGALNHTFLTLEALKARHISLRGIILNGINPATGNATTLRKSIPEIPVIELPVSQNVERLENDELRALAKLF